MFGNKCRLLPTLSKRFQAMVLLGNSLTDVCNVCRCILYQSTKILCGDWNCDQLPSCVNDPFAAEPERRNRHRQERLCLKALFDRGRVRMALPQLSAPNQPSVVRAHGDQIVTRMPSDPSQHPSLLDYGAANVVLPAATVDWTLWQSDHAAIKYIVQVPMQTKKTRATFQMSSEDELQSWIQCNHLARHTVKQLEQYAIKGQQLNQSAHNALTRSKMRLSTQARFYYAAAARAKQESQRRRFLKQAAEVRIQETARLRQNEKDTRFLKARCFRNQRSFSI